MTFELIVALVGFLASISSIIFAYLAFRRCDKQEQKTDGKTEGVMFSDIGYIKDCLERVKMNLNNMDERERNVVERLAKVEESVVNITKRIDEIKKLDSS